MLRLVWKEGESERASGALSTAFSSLPPSSTYTGGGRRGLCSMVQSSSCVQLEGGCKGGGWRRKVGREGGSDQYSLMSGK